MYEGFQGLLESLLHDLGQWGHREVFVRVEEVGGVEILPDREFVA